MKIYLTKPRHHWISPYTMAEKICFWRKIDYDEPWVQTFNKVVEPVSVAIRKILDIVHPEVKYVKIDYWDTWSMDYSLSPIILPMLKQLKKHKHGAPAVDDGDVPARLQSTTRWAQKAKKDNHGTDGNYFKRWDWVISEMIWAFEQLCDQDNDAQFWTGEFDHITVPHEYDSNGKVILWQLQNGPNHTAKFDAKASAKHQKRIKNGLRLFGKYYQNLWD